MCVHVRVSCACGCVQPVHPAVHERCAGMCTSSRQLARLLPRWQADTATQGAAVLPDSSVQRQCQCTAPAPVPVSCVQCRRQGQCQCQCLCQCLVSSVQCLCTASVRNAATCSKQKLVFEI
eukprot:365363-Chlamydomonas_euryale.AAC.6